jgi:Tol biopolymer transport system component
MFASAMVLFPVADVAAAQYFGRNKVQYDREDIRILATAHFDVYYAAEEAEAAHMVARLAERWHTRLSAVLEHSLTGRQPVVLYGSHRRFEQTNVYGGLIDESTGGFTDSRKRRIVLPFAKSLAETDHVLGHEIVHAFQFDISARHRSPLAVPLWFVEGMAEYLTLGAHDPQTSMWMRDAVASGTLPRIRDLSSSRYFPYRWGAALWSHLAEQYGADLPARALRAKRDVKRRLQELTGHSLEELTAGWHEALRARHATSGAARGPRPLIASRAGGGRLNVAASLSPDGRRLVFLSERDQFSIDLFLADAETGRIVRKLVTTAANAEFESLQYLHSAGTWDPEGGRFALATVSGGRPSLLILDIDRNDRREIRLSQVDEVYSPTWSADGRAIAFSAMRRGVSDLWVLDLAGGAVRQLTDDAYADLQPAWSPDGRSIALVTDRFTSSLRSLSFGAYRIALLDVETAAMTPVAGIEGANHFDPAWGPSSAASAGGRPPAAGPSGAGNLYFVADPGGIANVYRLDLREGRVSRITDVATGVSGVTRVSPMLSVASATGAVAFGVFRNSGYEVHRLTAPDELSGTAIDQGRVAASVPPGVIVAEAIEPVPPLPGIAAVGDSHPKYAPRLSLEGIGSPYLSAGGGPIGGYVAGGGSLLFGDLLGDHQLLTAVYVSSRLDESAFGAVYVNRRSRWNWGITAEQTPELRLRTNAVGVDPSRERVLTRERDRLLWTNRQLGGFAAYPFDRSTRLEVSGAMRLLSFERERMTEAVSMVSGQVVDQQTAPLAPEPSVGLVDTGVALIGDTAVFGATGPMLGRRYRIQATSTSGALKYTSVLADYRRYMMPVRPFTLAVRLVHSGRYGADANDFRLRDAYVGAPALVRGYSPGDVARAECPRGSADCPALNTLLANRLVAAKVELRIPFWSALTRTSRIRFSPVPMDAFVFADAGAGWGGEKRFGPGGRDGKFVRSAGAGIRTNVFGFVIEAAAVRPFDLRGAGWKFEITLRPGF